LGVFGCDGGVGAFHELCSDFAKKTDRDFFSSTDPDMRVP